MMDTNMPHDIFEDVSEDDINKLREQGRKLMELSEKEARELKPKTPEQRHKWMRKNRNRNNPCPCGSGVKFKKCCWNK